MVLIVAGHEGKTWPVARPRSQVDGNNYRYTNAKLSAVVTMRQHDNAANLSWYSRCLQQCRLTVVKINEDAATTTQASTTYRCAHLEASHVRTRHRMSRKRVIARLRAVSKQLK